MFYTELTFTIEPFSEDIAEMIIAEMTTIGFEGFTYTEDGFIAYIDSKNYNRKDIEYLSSMAVLSLSYTINYTENEIENQDWNKIWEENFSPITVKDKILVRAGFHSTIEGVEYEIIIDPKMSFGTGHHATTALMLETILDYKEEFKDRDVLDMGCGTGILSIMASKVGARHITGIDIDEWAYNNAMENLATNNTNNIDILIGDASLLTSDKHFDIILANINRNILLDDMESYNNVLKEGGKLIMSGFYTEDFPMISDKAKSLNLSFVSKKVKDNWVAAIFNK